MPDKEEGGEAVLRPLALPGLRSPYIPLLTIFIQGWVWNQEAKDRVIEEHTPKIEV